MSENSISVEGVCLEDVLLHRGSMLLLDSLISHHPERLSAAVHVSADSSFFLAPHGVPAWIAIEYMAQAIAALGGLNALGRGEPVPLGLLIGSQKFHSSCGYLPSGVELTVEVVENVAATYGLGAFEGRVFGAGVEISARLSVYVKPGGELSLESLSA